MNPLNWLNPGVWLAVLIVIGAGTGIGYWRGDVAGMASERAKWTAKENVRITAEQVATFKALEQNERERQQQAIDNRKVTNAHQTELATIRAAYERPAGRLRIAATVRDQFAAATKADRINSADAAAATTVELPEPIDRDLRRDADEVTAAARALQEWVRLNGFAE